MRAVLVHVTDEQLADRRAKGLDRWDEMWEGVLHMAPAPSFEHQRMVDRLIGFLEHLLRTTGRGQLVSGNGVFHASENYRIPDLTFVASGRDEQRRILIVSKTSPADRSGLVHRRRRLDLGALFDHHPPHHHSQHGQRHDA